MDRCSAGSYPIPACGRVKALRILALVTDAFGGRGGIARYNVDLLRAMAASEHVEQVLTQPRQGLAPPGAIPAKVIQEKPLGRLAFMLRALDSSLGRQRPQVIFCGHINFVVFAAVIARLTGAMMVLQTHGIEVWRRPSFATRWAAGRANLILCVSRDTRERVLDWCEIAPEKVWVQPNTVSPVAVGPVDTGVRAGLGLGARKVLLTVGRLSSEERYKGHDHVITALSSLLHQDCVYLIAGDGDDRPRLEALAREKGVTDRVIFLPDVPDLAPLYATADLFLMPSTGEGFGIVYLEAMASGTPSLGLGVAGAKDALLDGELGEMCTLADLPQVIDRLLDRRPPDRADLALRTQSHFGVAKFNQRIDAICGWLRRRAAGLHA